MIRAMIFDLAGTLVQTERLKARSYAYAAIELCPHNLGEAEVREAFKDVVGRPRREVAMALMKRFGLEHAARARIRDFGVSAPWQAFLQVRLRFFEEMVADPEVLRNKQWPLNVPLLQEARRSGCWMNSGSWTIPPRSHPWCGRWLRNENRTEEQEW